MPQTKTKRTTTPKAPATRKRSPAAKAPAARKRTTPSARATTAGRATTAVDTTAKMSEEVLETVERSQRAAIEAVRKFVDTVDEALPALPHGDGPSRRQEVLDAAMEMADRLVHTQYDFIRKVIDSTAKSLSKPDAEK